MVDEETLDRLIGAEILRTKKMYEENWSRMEWLVEKWTPKASTASAKISKLQEHILLLEEEVEVILMERIRDKANAERYDRETNRRIAEYFRNAPQPTGQAEAGHQPDRRHPARGQNVRSTSEDAGGEDTRS